MGSAAPSLVWLARIATNQSTGDSCVVVSPSCPIDAKRHPNVASISETPPIITPKSIWTDIGDAQATATFSQNFQLRSTRNRLPSSLSSDVAGRRLMPSTRTNIRAGPVFATRNRLESYIRHSANMPPVAIFYRFVISSPRKSPHWRYILPKAAALSLLQSTSPGQVDNSWLLLSQGKESYERPTLLARIQRLRFERRGIKGIGRPYRATASSCSCATRQRFTRRKRWYFTTNHVSRPAQAQTTMEQSDNFSER